MDREELLHRQNERLSCLSHLPRKMLSLHGIENIAEFVLHDLCHKDCFNLKRAAYFVNNPDFNCLKGIAGISQKDVPGSLWSDIWKQSEMFSTYMRNSPFNRKVRGLRQCSFELSEATRDEIIECLSRKLDMESPLFYSLNMKHDNHGIFIYEKNDHDEDSLDSCFLNGVSLLGFCPIF